MSLNHSAGGGAVSSQQCASTQNHAKTGSQFVTSICWLSTPWSLPAVANTGILASLARRIDGPTKPLTRLFTPSSSCYIMPLSTGPDPLCHAHRVFAAQLVLVNAKCIMVDRITEVAMITDPLPPREKRWSGSSSLWPSAPCRAMFPPDLALWR